MSHPLPKPGDRLLWWHNGRKMPCSLVEVVRLIEGHGQTIYEVRDAGGVCFALYEAFLIRETESAKEKP
jgi:hypothetical protein